MALEKRCQEDLGWSDGDHSTAGDCRFNVSEITKIGGCHHRKALQESQAIARLNHEANSTSAG